MIALWVMSIQVFAEEFSPQTVLIPSGTFTMGCTSEKSLCFADEYPPHSVILTKQFYIMTHEVTQELYQNVMGHNPSFYQQCGNKCPVEQTSWLDATRFANALSEKMNLPLCYEIQEEKVQWTDHSCIGWRLPTEAEWEYAARGGENLIYSGSNNISDVASTGKGKHDFRPSPVCTYKKNGYQLCDMSGNVFEWVWDTYASYPSKPQTDPYISQKENPVRSRRGGSWCDFAKLCRTSTRYGSYFSFRYKYQGFRLVRTHSLEEK